MNNPITPAETAAKLRGFGISPSPQRVAIYGFLLSHPTHPTAETIFTAVRAEQPSISLTTVYNTLKLLTGKHAVQTVIIEDGELRYDGDIREHAHFKCLKCGRVYDIFPEPGCKIAPPPKLPSGFTITEMHVCCRGYCPQPECAQENSSC